MLDKRRQKTFPAKYENVNTVLAPDLNGAIQLKREQYGQCRTAGRKAVADKECRLMVQSQAEFLPDFSSEIRANRHRGNVSGFIPFPTVRNIENQATSANRTFLHTAKAFLGSNPAENCGLLDENPPNIYRTEGRHRYIIRTETHPAV